MLLIGLVVLHAPGAAAGQLKITDVGSSKAALIARERSQFGDPDFNTDEYGAIVTCHYAGLGNPQTEMYFPVGRSDVRYYVNFLDTGKQYFVKESRRGNKVHVIWVVPLEWTYPRPALLKRDDGDSGTIFLMLARRGFFWDGTKMPVGAAGDFTAHYPLAGYVNVGRMFAQLSYWFVNVDGVPTMADILDFDQQGELVKSVSPYPLTKIERSIIADGWAGRSNMPK